MWKVLRPGFMMMVAMTVLTGVMYPAFVTIVAQAVFPAQANGSLVRVNGHLVGSRLIGQNFARPEYFHPRPSEAGANGYDPTSTGGSNLGPTSAALINGIKVRILHYCIDNGLPFDLSRPLDAFKNASGELDDATLIRAFGDAKNPLVVTAETPIPADAVTASASGLDPDISPRNAELQASRVAAARRVGVDDVKVLVARYTQGRTLGILGEPHVNVLELNLALDEQFHGR